MFWLQFLLEILAVVAVALLLGWTYAKAKSPAVQSSVCIGSILFLLAMRFGFINSWEFCLLLLAFVFRSLDNLPSFIRNAIAVTIIWWLAEYRIRVMVAEKVRALATEIERTNVRLQLMENSIMAKFDNISHSQTILPPRSPIMEMSLGDSTTRESN